MNYQVSPAAARINRGLKQKEAAALIGINVRTLQHYEKGITYPNAKIVNKMYEVYGIDADHLQFS